LKKSEVDLKTSCTFFGGFSGRAKCDVLEGLGRTLHGAEDFYSHSNWSDQAAPGPVGVDNPPGLGHAGVAPVLDLRAAGVSVPPALSTGCFSLIPFGCRKRVTHGVLNKDEGLVDPSTGATSSPTTPRGRVGTNFDRAVSGAVAEAGRQWKDLAAEIVATYGATKGNLMICAITHDDPMKDCTGRLLVIVVDSSGSNQETDPGNLRIGAAQAFNESLVGEAEANEDERPDQSASVDFDDSARLISPLGDPSRTSFAGIDSDGGTDIGAGVSVAIQELTTDPQVDPRDRGGIVVLTDGQDGGSSLPGALAQAQSLGIRVSFGFLSPPANPVPAVPRTTSGDGGIRLPADVPLPEYLPAILATGGTYAVIDSAQAQRSFVTLARQTGLTNLDDPSGSAPGGPLVPGLQSAGLATREPATWTYRARRGGTAELTIQAPPGSRLTARIRDVRRETQIARLRTDGSGLAKRRVRSFSGELRIDVPAVNGEFPYTIRADEADVLQSGPGRADRLACRGSAPTYVHAGAGRDHVSCSAAADTLVGGPDTDRLGAGSGDDLFIVDRGDLKVGTERLMGGPGNDTALFLFQRPRGVTCRHHTTARVPIARGTVRLTGVERVLFAYRPCEASALPHVSLPRLRPAIAHRPPLVPPKPFVRATASKGAVHARIRVGAATTVLVTAIVRSGHRSTTIQPVIHNVPGPGLYRYTLRFTPRARTTIQHGGQVTLKVTTAGTLDGPQRHGTVHVHVRP
jgi:hypothetical protein